MARKNTAEAIQEPLPIAPTTEEAAAAFVRCSHAKRALEDATSRKKMAQEEFTAAFEALMLIGRRFELAGIGAHVAKATKEYVEQQADTAEPVASVALVPLDAEYEVMEA